MAFRLPCFALLLVAAAVQASSAPARAADRFDRPAIVAKLCGDAAGMASAAATISAGAAAGDAEDLSWGLRLVKGVIDRALACSPNSAVLGAAPATVDAATLNPTAPLPDAKTPVLSLKNRAAFETAAAVLTLLADPAPGARAAALKTLERRPESAPVAVLDRAAAAETVPELRQAIAGLAQTAALKSSNPAKRIEAVRHIAATPSTRTLTLLRSVQADPATKADPALKAAVDGAVTNVERWLQVSAGLSAFYNGMSFASILFMAAVGLAVIFGLMGVINLAQGEFIMIGAYVTFLVQELFRRVAPGLLDWYLIAAIPVVFGVTAMVGIVIEQFLIRHFYRRPLMSLLATWAVSLFLVNIIRVTFGTQNLQFETPFYVSGGLHVVGDFIVTWNRLFAIVFAAATLALVGFVLRRTPLGLNIRAVTLNRDMAGCIGIPTRTVDRLAFGLGSGLAGLAGLALSPIYNVNPQMGTLFIIDSFMVVVLGGVGTLVGTVVAAIGVGQINVLIEPLYGAVAAKVIVLLMIIAFLQWRPEGLFAIAGRRK
jgi:urea transport system permease protein